MPKAFKRNTTINADNSKVFALRIGSILMRKILAHCPPSPKLEHKRIGPFQIIDTWRQQSYKLKLTPLLLSYSCLLLSVSLSASSKSAVTEDLDLRGHKLQYSRRGHTGHFLGWYVAPPQRSSPWLGFRLMESLYAFVDLLVVFYYDMIYFR